MPLPCNAFRMTHRSRFRRALAVRAKREFRPDFTARELGIPSFVREEHHRFIKRWYFFKDTISVATGGNGVSENTRAPDHHAIWSDMDWTTCLEPGVPHKGFVSKNTMPISASARSVDSATCLASQTAGSAASTQEGGEKGIWSWPDP